MRWLLFTYGLLCTLSMQAIPASHAPAHNNIATCFVENKGQLIDQYGQKRNDIDYRMHLGSLNVFIGKGQLHYQWTKEVSDTRSRLTKSGRLQMEAYRMDMRLLGANLSVKPVAEEAQNYYENYYLPQCPKGIKAGSFGRIVYRNIYPNIDWVIYTKQGTLEYDFIVHPGGNTADIRMQYSGATSLQTADGRITAETPFGHITEQAPYCYEAETQTEIRASFAQQNNIISFNAAPHKGTLVIDPIIAWASYFGGNNADGSNAVRTDALGSVYIAGYTASTVNLATSGSFQTTLAGNFDGFVSSFTGAGQLRWATYFGGADEDRFTGGDLDMSTGHFYVCGYTRSSGLGTSGTEQQFYGGGRMDAIIADFSSTGTLRWSSYLGGLRFDSATSVACNGLGAIYVGGQATSGNGISTSGAHQTGLILPANDSFNSFVVKYNANNGTRAWGTYFPALIVTSVATYGSNAVYATGVSLTSSGIAFGNSHQGIEGDPFDGFLVKFDGNGAGQWGTYYGGSNPDYAYAVACDANGDIYIGGETRSANNIASIGAQQGSINGFSNAFLAKFNPAGNRTWGTYFGTGNGNGIYGIDFDASGNIYTTGTTSGSGVSTPDGYQPLFGGGAFDGFMAEFKSGGNFTWGTYIGGPAHDEGNSIAYDNTNKLIYVSGTTYTLKNLFPPGNFQDSSNGGGEAYVAAFMSDTTYLFVNKPIIDSNKCAGDSIDIGFSSHDFKGANVFKVELSDENGNFGPTIVIGTVTSIAGKLTVRCAIPPGMPTGTKYHVRVTGSNPSFVSPPSPTALHIDHFPGSLATTNNGPICVGTQLQLKTTSYPGVVYNWSRFGFAATGADTLRNNIQMTDSGWYMLKAVFGNCKTKDSTHVVIKSNPVLPGGLSNNAPICENDTLRLKVNDTSKQDGYKYSWTGPNNFTSTERNPEITDVTVAAIGVFTLKASLDICSVEDTTSVHINPAPPIPSVSSNSPIYTGADLKLFANSSVPGVAYSWTGPDSFASYLQNPIIGSATIDANGLYTVVITAAGCTSKAQIAVSVTAKDINVFTLFPNPNQGLFTIKANVQADQRIPIQIVDGAGHIVYRQTLITTKKRVYQPIELPAYLANGVYQLYLRVDGQAKAMRLVLCK